MVHGAIKCLRVMCQSANLTAMQGETPNIHLVHSVWRRLKKAKIRDLQPIKDVKGGGAATGKSTPPTGGTGTAGNRGSR